MNLERYQVFFYMVYIRVNVWGDVEEADLLREWDTRTERIDAGDTRYKVSVTRKKMSQ